MTAPYLLIITFVGRESLTFRLWCSSSAFLGASAIDNLLEKYADKYHIRAVVRRKATAEEFADMDVEVRNRSAQVSNFFSLSQSSFTSSSCLFFSSLSQWCSVFVCRRWSLQTLSRASISSPSSVVCAWLISQLPRQKVR